MKGLRALIFLFLIASACQHGASHRGSESYRQGESDLPPVPESVSPTPLDIAKPVTLPHVPPGQALEWLKKGNLRFARNNFRQDGESTQDRQKSLLTQQPHSLVVACGDSRVPPELIFDQKLGEIYVVRTAGESIDTAALASIEFAVLHYKIGLIYVLGHNHCDVLQRAKETPEGISTGSPSVDLLFEDLRSHLSFHQVTSLSTNEDTQFAIDNALAVARDLTQRSVFLFDKVNSGLLVVKAGIYRLETGLVETF